LTEEVAIEPPRIGVLKHLDNASIAPPSGSVALLFHLSGIFQASCTWMYLGWAPRAIRRLV